MKALIATILFANTLCASAIAQPIVVVDIPPIRGLVSAVVDGVLPEPVVLLPPGTNPHHGALKPSAVAALADADVVVWVGPELTPYLKPDGRWLPLLQAGGISLLPTRSGVRLEGRGDGIDPHAWLDPQIASAWVGAIARALASLEPDNAERYLANARAEQSRIEAAESQVRAMVTGIGPYVLDHDAFQYFEARFGLTPLASTRDDEDTAPGPRRMAEAISAAQDADCLIGVPETPDALARRLGVDRTIRIDPLGSDADYSSHLIAIARAFAACGG